MKEGVSVGKLPELTGGGLVRSVGRWMNLMERGLKRESLFTFHESENVKNVPKAPPESPDPCAFSCLNVWPYFKAYSFIYFSIGPALV